MSLTIGTDTYIDIEEADEYVILNYTSDHEKRISWELLNDTDKEIYLRNALVLIESCNFKGEKYIYTQSLEFPRFLELYYSGNGEIPTEIKAAQIEEALEQMLPGKDTEAKDKRTGPVKSYTIGKLSESMGNAAGSTNSAAFIMNSSKAALLLNKYISGGFAIR